MVNVGVWNRRRSRECNREKAVWYGSGTPQYRSIMYHRRVDKRIKNRWSKW